MSLTILEELPNNKKAVEEELPNNKEKQQARALVVVLLLDDYQYTFVKAHQCIGALIMGQSSCQHVQALSSVFSIDIHFPRVRLLEANPKVATPHSCVILACLIPVNEPRCHLHRK